MKTLPIAGLVGLAALGAQAQDLPLRTQSLDPVVVTATRALAGGTTLRDATVITREELDASGGLSLGEVLARRAGVELRATGGPGQPQGILIRGAGTAQTLVLIDGMRAGSATQGTTSIESIPIEMIERIEVVKGPLSSLYGSEAAGGVIQIFTRGKEVPHFFGTAAYGTDNDGRASAGIATADETTRFSMSAGARKVDAPSATNARNVFCHDPDDDPHENAFVNLRGSHRLWQGEILTLEAFGSRSRTHFDGCGVDDRSHQTISGARFSSVSQFTSWWTSTLTLGQGRDKLEFHGGAPAQFETRQDQAGWINEFGITDGALILGLETLRQSVQPARRTENGTEVILYTRDRRDTDSAFVSVYQNLFGQRVEASARRDRDDQFGRRDTGSLSYGAAWPGLMRIALTLAHGFRAPTFNDLYGPSFEGFYTPNPDLRPERSDSREITLRSLEGAAWQWRVTAFDNRLEDLIVYSAAEATVLNVNQARIRGVEAAVEGAWKGVRLRGSVTVQRPRDEIQDTRLQGRAEHFGSVEATHSFGAWSGGVMLHAVGDRFDSTNEAPASRLPSYAVVDARVRYKIDKFWSAEVVATNLFDRRYESAVGYDAPRRGVMLNVRFEAF